MDNNNNLKPGVAYKWAPGSNFPLTDAQFSALFNNLNAIAQSPSFQQKLEEAKATLAIAQLQGVMNDILSAAVGSGIAVESDIQTDGTLMSQGANTSAASDSPAPVDTPPPTSN